MYVCMYMFVVSICYERALHMRACARARCVYMCMCFACFYIIVSSDTSSSFSSPIAGDIQSSLAAIRKTMTTTLVTIILNNRVIYSVSARPSVFTNATDLLA